MGNPEQQWVILLKASNDERTEERETFYTFSNVEWEEKATSEDEPVRL